MHALVAKDMANNAKYKNFLCIGRSYFSLYSEKNIAINILNSNHFGKFMHLSQSTPRYLNALGTPVFH